MNKTQIHQALLAEIEAKIAGLQSDLQDIRSALTSDSKSTAGDKHETSRAMAHREQEQLGAQLNQFIQLKRIAMGINPDEQYATVQYGSLVRTNQGLFFFSVGFGKIILDSKEVFCISATTPLGKALLEKKAGDLVNFNGRDIEILTVS